MTSDRLSHPAQRELVWWDESTASLSVCASHQLDHDVQALLMHRKADEVVLVDSTGHLSLFHPALRRETSSLGARDSGLTTVWSGVVAISKVVHVLVLLRDAAQRSHHLRVVRIASAPAAEVLGSVFDEPGRVDWPERLGRLEHVCAHLLLPPGGCEGDALVRACFDELTLRLTTLWSRGALSSYDFFKARQLAALHSPPPVKPRAAVLAVPESLVGTLTLASWLPELVACAWTSDEGRVTCCVVNTALGVVPCPPVEGGDADGAPSAGPVQSLVAASNEQFLLVATAEAVYRCTLQLPASTLLRDCVGAHRWAEAVFGAPVAGSLPATECWSVTFADGADDDGSAQPEPMAEDQRRLLAASFPKKQKRVESILAHYQVPGKGHREGASRLAVMWGRDHSRLDVEVAQQLLMQGAAQQDWPTVASVVRARVVDAPPVGLVAAVVAADCPDVALALAENCLSLGFDDTAALFAYAVRGSHDGLFAALVRWQAVTADDEWMRVALSRLEASTVQAMFTRLADMLESPQLNSRGRSSVLDWLCAVLDSQPHTFELDPVMRERVTALHTSTSKLLRAGNKWTQLKLFLEVLRYNTLDVPQHAPTDYRVEYVAFH